MEMNLVISEVHIGGQEDDILVYDCSEELKTWEDLSLWDRGLDDGRYLCDPDILGCYVVRSRYGRNVDIYE